MLWRRCDADSKWTELLWNRLILYPIIFKTIVRPIQNRTHDCRRCEAAFTFF